MSHSSNGDDCEFVFPVHVMQHDGFDLLASVSIATLLLSLPFTMDTPLTVPPPRAKRYLEKECADYKRWDCHVAVPVDIHLILKRKQQR